MASIKANIILNGINTVTGIIYPVITFPYAARVLLPNGIGTVNFLNSIINYIVLLTSLGIPMYAVKEVAKYRDNKQLRDQISTEILILSIGLCIVGYIAVLLLAKFIPQIHEQASLFYILSLTIIFNAIGVNWFYQGIEDFKFITVRAIIIRTLSAAALFIFVKDSSDLLIYGFILVGSTVGNNIINFFHIRKHLSKDKIKIKNLKILRHLRPALEVFLLNLIISLYIQLNSIMLGFISGDTEVGFFAAGTKISHIGLTLISSLCTVLLPRCSNLINKGEIDVYNNLIKKSLHITIAFSFPMAIGLMVLATPLTIVFCGIEYYSSVPVLLLNAPVIILINLSNLMVIQILYPMDKMRIIISCVSSGAVSNFLLNFLLIPRYGATGAAISTLVAELMVMLSLMISGKKFYPFTYKNLLNVKNLLGSFIMGAIVIFSTHYISSCAYKLLIGISIGILSYSLILVLLKDPILVEIHKIIYKRINR